jgi:hypothetical protein
MAAAQKLLPGLAGAGPQDGELAPVVQQENLGMVQVELFLDQIDELGQQRGQPHGAGGDLADLGNRQELIRGALGDTQLDFQIAAEQPQDQAGADQIPEQDQQAQLEVRATGIARRVTQPFAHQRQHDQGDRDAHARQEAALTVQHITQQRHDDQHHHAHAQRPLIQQEDHAGHQEQRAEEQPGRVQVSDQAKERDRAQQRGRHHGHEDDQQRRRGAKAVGQQGRHQQDDRPQRGSQPQHGQGPRAEERQAGWIDLRESREQIAHLFDHDA